jgi:hypothetical protein
MLRHGGFYTTQLTIFKPDGSTLKRGVDFKPTYLYGELSELTHQEVFGMIVITNPDVPADLTVSYRAVGGMFGVPADELKALLLAASDDNFPFTWDSIIAKPRYYAPEAHEQEWWETYGWEWTVTELKRIGKAVQIGNKGMLDEAKAYGDAQIAQDRLALANYSQPFETHYLDTNDPHDVTATQVGLGNLQNWPMATQPEAVAGATNRYMSPTRVYQQLEAEALPSLRNHISDFNRPHRETAAQIGAYLRNQTDSLVASRLPRDAVAYDSWLLQGASYRQLFDQARTNLYATDVVSGVFPANKLAPGGSDGNYVLVGGAWRSIAEIFETYGKRPVYVAWTGYHGNPAQLKQWLDTTFGYEAYGGYGGAYCIATLHTGFWNGELQDSVLCYLAPTGGWVIL